MIWGCFGCLIFILLCWTMGALLLVFIGMIPWVSIGITLLGLFAITGLSKLLFIGIEEGRIEDRTIKKKELSDRGWKH
jgi:hypothetical protein